MNNRTLAIALLVLAVVFLVLNFVVADAGTLFLILAVVCGLVVAYLLTRPGTRA